MWRLNTYGYEYWYEKYGNIESPVVTREIRLYAFKHYPQEQSKIGKSWASAYEWAWKKLQQLERQEKRLMKRQRDARCQAEELARHMWSVSGGMPLQKWVQKALI